MVAGAGVLASQRSHCATGSSMASRQVRAHYLRPDADELDVLEALKRQHPTVNLTWGDSLPSSPKPPGAAPVEVLITRLPTAAELDSLPQLRHVVVPFAGPTELTKSLVKERPALSLHNAHFNAASTAELAVSLLLAVAKRVVAQDAAFRAEVVAGTPWTTGWDPEADTSLTLAGRRALILGYGAIGSRVGVALSALGMDVHAVRRSAGGSNQAAGSGNSGARRGEVAMHGLGELDALLASSDVVVVCLPGTPATANLLGDRELRLLPRGSLLVNVGRGSVIDEDALFGCLADGHLGGAGIDVWYNYPQLQGQGIGKGLALNQGPAARPFHELRNVVMSPHRGQSSDIKAANRVGELFGMLSALSDTGDLPNRYDLDRGY